MTRARPATGTLGANRRRHCSSLPAFLAAGVLAVGGFGGLTAQAVSDVTSAQGHVESARRPLGPGTSWLAASTPRRGIIIAREKWLWMIHGFATLGYANDPAPRGDQQAFGTSMVALKGGRSVGRGNVAFSLMASGEPVMGPRGYPLLLQTGETADGLVPLFDRQHPHDLFMEISALYRAPLAEGGAVFVYAAPVGSPAIGPVPFMHRLSAGPNPVAPIGHHLLDATHISHGVVTVGYEREGLYKLEASVFNGHEPDQDRWDIQAPDFDSFALRVAVNPHKNWSLQASFADLAEPDQLHPGITVTRLTASATYNRPLPRGNWQTTFAFGRNKNERTTLTLAEAREIFSPPVFEHFVGVASLPDGIDDSSELLIEGSTQAAALLESALKVGRMDVFGRFEAVGKQELFGPQDLRHSQAFSVAKASLGVGADVAVFGVGRLSLGAVASLHFVGSDLEEVYGGTPASLQVFTRLELE